MSERQTIRYAGLVAVLSMTGGVLADLCTFYTCAIRSLDAAMPLLSLNNLLPAILDKPYWQITMGHYLALILIPSGAAGLYPIYRALQRTPYYLPEIIAVLGILGFTSRTAFHLGFGYVISGLQETHGTEILHDLISRFEPLVLSTAAVSLSTMILSFVLILMVTVFGQSPYPSWFVLVNPVPVQFLLNGRQLSSISIPNHKQSVLLSDF